MPARPSSAAAACLRGQAVPGALALLAVALLGLQWQGTRPNAELLSLHIEDAEIRAQRSLDSFWTKLDKARALPAVQCKKLGALQAHQARFLMCRRTVLRERALTLRSCWQRADREARKVRALHRARFESGEGTRFESEEAERLLRTASDWGKDGADQRASVWRRSARSSEHRQRSDGAARDATVKFFRTAAEHPRAARKAMREIVGELARQDAHGRERRQGSAKKARVEELADATLAKHERGIVGKEMVRQANQGLFGSSLTGLVRNVFGGPHSKIARYAEKHRARTGHYQWSALGSPHWDANGDPIVAKAVANDRGLAGAGVKTTNSLKELYKDVSGTRNKNPVKGKGTMHLVRLMDNLLYGKPVKRQGAGRHEDKKKAAAHFARELAEHKFDGKMLVGKTDSFFGDEQSADTEPNEVLNNQILEPEPVAAQPDDSKVAKKLKDNEMLISGDKGFFKDQDDENPQDKMLAAAKAQAQAKAKLAQERADQRAARARATTARRTVNAVQKLAAKAAERRAEDVKDYKVLRAVDQEALDSEHDKDVAENHQLARRGEMRSFLSGVNGQAPGRTRPKTAQPRHQSADALSKAEHQVVRAEEAEQEDERKVRARQAAPGVRGVAPRRRAGCVMLRVPDEGNRRAML